MLPAIKSMYEDAMVLEDLYEAIRLFKLVETGPALDLWNETSDKIEDSIKKLADYDIELGTKVFKAWKSAKSVTSDIRELSYHICLLSNVLSDALNKYYEPINIGDEKYVFAKTNSSFLTVKSLKSGKYYHDLIDPMNEARELARELYDPGMSEFHLFGVGLGYLAYAIWELSDRTLLIHVYEDDKAMLEYAYQTGVLSWVSPDHIDIVDFSDCKDLITKFGNLYEDYLHIHYVSDWKVGLFSPDEGSEMISHIDYNERLTRTNKIHRKINERVNYCISSGTIEEYAAKANYAGKEFVIVSAGPSLDDCIPFIRESVGKRVIISVNTSLKRLAKEGIYADVSVVIDPDPVLENHVKDIEQYTESIPLILPKNASQSFSSRYKGKKYLVTNYEKTKDGFVWNFGGTVSSFAIDIACYLKASKVYLIGNDLAYSMDRNFASGVSHSEKEGMDSDSVYVDGTDGNKVRTNKVYNKYRHIIEEQIRKHPEVLIVNMAKHGAKINGTMKF